MCGNRTSSEVVIEDALLQNMGLTSGYKLWTDLEGNKYLVNVLCKFIASVNFMNGGVDRGEAISILPDQGRSFAHFARHL